jgi:hypothetical protein
MITLSILLNSRPIGSKVRLHSVFNVNLEFICLNQCDDLTHSFLVGIGLTLRWRSQR